MNPESAWVFQCHRGADGGIFTFGDAVFRGSGLGRLISPAVALAEAPNGDGYWILSQDGNVFEFGVPYLGGQRQRPQPGCGHGGKGYLLYASDGGVYSFGDASYLGGTTTLTLTSPIVGGASTPAEPTR